MVRKAVGAIGSTSALLRQIAGYVLEKGVLIGTYQRA
jgi:hypothetical protein